MKRCIELAKKGKGFVAPNPLVGSVIIHDNKIIGEGYHQNYGEAHAEVNAIKAVKNKKLLKESTIYVTLEPCAHHGKTPPCADLIIKHQIKNVVIGCVDSFSEVAGKGIQRMQSAGINVRMDVLKDECRELNKRFFTFHEKKRPYIILKWAQSKDGFIDKIRDQNSKGIFWITQAETKSLVHQWRHEESGILVGRKTIANDNPNLTVREIKGLSPTRIVIDKDLRLDYTAFNIGDFSVPTLILTKKEVKSGNNLRFIKPKSFSTNDILELLYQESIQSILVEGGKGTLEHFIEDDLWDEARILNGVNEIKKGLPAPLVSGKTESEFSFGKDFVKIIRNV